MLPPGELLPTLSREAARRRLAGLFRAAGIDSADLDARVLLCAACCIDHAGLTRDPDVALDRASVLLSEMCRRRLAHEPVSRILGRREFWGLSFTVNPDVLDPRPETEGLVGSILDAVGGQRNAKLEILDLGTGSGAILCALLHELPQARGIGVDRSAPACRVARQNLEALGLANRGAIVCGDWGEALASRFDVVVSNPPYIPNGDLPTLDPGVRKFDPAAALDGGDDGLDAYRALAPRLPSLLLPGGVAAFECGFDQSDQIVALLSGAGLTSVMIYKDLAGIGRVVLGTFV